MNRITRHLPSIATLIAIAAMLLHGPIAQLPRYHEFADRRVFFGLPNGLDVLSNIGFFAVGAFGFYRLWPLRRHPLLIEGWPGYQLFIVALMLTAIGSSFYHLAPDNMRLIWDRLPIALACAGLLAAVRADTRSIEDSRLSLALLACAGVFSVAWWYGTEQLGHGDLRPYLLLQGLPLVLIPLWQTIHHAPRADKLAFGGAIFLYVLAKAAELHDHQLLQLLGWLGGHTLKHFLATAAAAVLVGRLVWRTHAAAAG